MPAGRRGFGVLQDGCSVLGCCPPILERCSRPGSPRRVPAGAALRRAHADLKIKNEHFNEVAEILASTLDDNGLSAHDRDTLMEVVASTRDVIVEITETAA